MCKPGNLEKPRQEREYTQIVCIITFTQKYLRQGTHNPSGILKILKTQGFRISQNIQNPTVL